LISKQEGFIPAKSTSQSQLAKPPFRLLLNLAVTKVLTADTYPPPVTWITTQQ